MTENSKMTVFLFFVFVLVWYIFCVTTRCLWKSIQDIMNWFWARVELCIVNGIILEEDAPSLCNCLINNYLALLYCDIDQWPISSGCLMPAFLLHSFAKLEHTEDVADAVEMFLKAQLGCWLNIAAILHC